MYAKLKRSCVVAVGRTARVGEIIKAGANGVTKADLVDLVKMGIAEEVNAAAAKDANFTEEKQIEDMSNEELAAYAKNAKKAELIEIGLMLEIEDFGQLSNNDDRLAAILEDLNV